MMTLRWQPWQEMETLRRQFAPFGEAVRMFEDMIPAREALLNSDEQPWIPAIELTSTDTELTLRAQLPGIDAEHLDIQVGRKAVSISGEHTFENKTDENGYFHSEFRYGSFNRVIALPVPVQNDQVKAEFKDGILTLTLPRVEALKPSVVKVTLAGTTTSEAIAPAEQPSENGSAEAIDAEHNQVEAANSSNDAWQS
ncbi:Hsp20/alpha crystallin family protein [Myxacorys almedinensis]|uniref:Hsp20 family protein n=1 Tax=Myxacorys almedinensis A TaxID=2690445 RepID=A0A8J8CH18_9CYAN|nr:Hsp20/alpha crystallin family protein [Myxacorys almedinensis]NDJ16308.1 Hsp20 family protein [Myxacorys almedinensis A]